MRIRNDTRLSMFHTMQIILTVAFLSGLVYAEDYYGIEVISTDAVFYLGMTAILVNILAYYLGTTFIKKAYEYSIKSVKVHFFGTLLLLGMISAVAYFSLNGDITIKISYFSLVVIAYIFSLANSILIYPLYYLKLRIVSSYRYPPPDPEKKRS